MKGIWVWTLLACCALVSSAWAAEPPPPACVQTHLDRVALFKNGLGHFVRRGTLTGDQREVLVGPFAAPVHGTFWVSAPTTAGLGGVIARQVNVRGEMVEAREVGDLLRANVGRKVSVWPTQDTETPITGTILSFAPDRPRIQPRGRDYQMGTVGEIRGEQPYWGRNDYVLIQTADGVVGLNAYSIARVEFPGDEVCGEYAVEIPGAELTVSLTTPKAGDWIGVSYLAKGITWAPSYLVDISDPKTARLSAKAEIINEAEDLANAHVDLITGFPHLQFADVLSPIGKKLDLYNFLQQLGGRRVEAGASVMTQAVMSNVAAWERAGGPAGPMPEYGAGAQGVAVEDLFFYPLESITLKVGETGCYPLFTVSVPYQQIYQWTVPDYINASERYDREQSEPREIVWHSLRLTNTTTTPWTTAPGETVKSGQVLGQDTLSYTAPQAESTLKITQAVSVKAEQSEIETDRQREALRMYGDYFDRVTIQGTLRVTNYKSEAIRLEVKKTVSGEVKTTTPTPKITTLAAGLKRMNQVHELTWTVDLKPGQTQEIAYTYAALIRR